MIRRFVVLIILLLAASAQALEPSQIFLTRAWSPAPAARIDEIGRGVGVVFSPDLSVKENCRFYRTLGFGCFQDADWSHILDSVHEYNVLHPERRLHTLILETHGTNGNGLKVQTSYAPTADRSYISVGALQERLEPEGVDYIIISACNSGRLLRPVIYATLDPNPGDKLFLPPNCGIVNASDDFDPRLSPITILTPQQSHIETTLVGATRELAPATRGAIVNAAKAAGITPPVEFAVSDMMMQMITRDHRLQLAANTPVEDVSKEIQDAQKSEQLFKRFTTFLNAVSTRQSMTKMAKTKTATKKPAPARRRPTR
jgi:hypothetical protein